MASLEIPPAGGDRNKAPAFATITIILSVVAMVSVVARLYVRSRVIRQVGVDDVIITISLVSVVHPILSKYLGCLTPLSRLSGLQPEYAVLLLFITAWGDTCITSHSPQSP